MNKITIIIDGFDLYYSAVDASRDQKWASTKWLNIYEMCHSYISSFGKDAKIQQIYYFSALAKHLTHKNPDKVERHKKFIKCLEDTGINVKLHRFKPKWVHFRINDDFKMSIRKHEEKETDVEIAVKLMESFFNDDCDTGVLFTGDTDLSPAKRTVKDLFPKKQLWIMFPHKRYNKELKQLVGENNVISIKKERYIKHQFSDPYTLKNGNKIDKPVEW